MRIDWDVQINNSALQRIVEQAKRALYEAAYAAALDILKEIELDLQRIYNEVVGEFYSSYSPAFYGRNGSLYDLLVFESSGDSVRWGFDPSNATPFERGGGSGALYEHVFRQGWHGGATGTDHNGYSVGTPSYREPIPWYSNWGAMAASAGRAPLDAWNQEVEAYKNDVLPGRFNELYRQHLAKYGFR